MIYFNPVYPLNTNKTNTIGAIFHAAFFYSQSRDAFYYTEV